VVTFIFSMPSTAPTLLTVYAKPISTIVIVAESIVEPILLEYR